MELLVGLAPGLLIPNLHRHIKSTKCVEQGCHEMHLGAHLLQTECRSLKMVGQIGGEEYECMRYDNDI